MAVITREEGRSRIFAELILSLSKDRSAEMIRSYLINNPGMASLRIGGEIADYNN